METRERSQVSLGMAKSRDGCKGVSGDARPRPQAVPQTPKEEDEKVIEDEEEIRVWFNKVYDRFVDPEHILISPCEEGSMVVWNNWVCLKLAIRAPLLIRVIQGVMHSAMQYPIAYGSRSSEYRNTHMPHEYWRLISGHLQCINVISPRVLLL